MSQPVFNQLLLDEINRALVNAIAYIFGAGVAGDVAEFGTMTGRTAGVLAQFLAEIETYWGGSDQQHGIPMRSMHLFDSFEGLPLPSHVIDANSLHVRSQIWDKGLLRGISAEQLATLVEQYLQPERVRIYEGFFVDTLPEIPSESRFALLHIDCDFYESTYQVLDHLFGRRMVSEGAILLFDDWNCNRASPAFGERKAWQDVLEKYCVSYSDEGSYSVFGHKFIVHRIEDAV